MTNHKPNCQINNECQCDKCWNGVPLHGICTCNFLEEEKKCCNPCNIYRSIGCDCQCHQEPQKCNERIINSAGECIDGLCKSDHTPESQEDWEKQWIEFVKYNGVSIFESAEKNHFLKIKAFIHQTLATERKKVLEGLLEKLPKKFWEDEDHAVGGYISKKDLKNIINTLLGE